MSVSIWPKWEVRGLKGEKRAALRRELLQEIKKGNIFRICQQTIPVGELHFLQRRKHCKTISFSVKRTTKRRGKKQTTPTGQFQREEGGKKASRREIVSVA
jgi:antitoxin (DNA-binding transcriptional repressor) of toxin-antitoxin stability system